MKAKEARHQSGDTSCRHSVPWIQLCDKSLSVPANCILQHWNTTKQHVATNTCQLCYYLLALHTYPLCLHCKQTPAFSNLTHGWQHYSFIYKVRYFTSFNSISIIYGYTITFNDDKIYVTLHFTQNLWKSLQNTNFKKSFLQILVQVTQKMKTCWMFDTLKFNLLVKSHLWHVL